MTIIFAKAATTSMMTPLTPRLWLPPILLFIGIIALLFGIYAVLPHESIWEGWKLGKGGRIQEYCETNDMDSLLRQPINSWSNLAYLLCGLLMFQFGRFDLRSEHPQNLLQQCPVFTFLAGLSAIYLCAGSFFYHASLSHLGQQADMGGTYAVLAAPLAIGLFRLSAFAGNLIHRPVQLNRLKWAVVALLLIADVCFFVFKWHIDSKIAFPLLILLNAAVLLLYQTLSKRPHHLFLLISAFLSLILSFAIWVLDRQKIFCDPDSWLQGHALWHVLTAISIFLVYLYMRSDTQHKEL